MLVSFCQYSRKVPAGSSQAPVRGARYCRGGPEARPRPGPERLRYRAQILKELGLRRIRLLTNNLTKIVGLRSFGLEITKRVPIEVEPNGHNERYLKTKRDKLNHVFEKF
jgi:hypothetical protein